MFKFLLITIFLINSANATNFFMQKNKNINNAKEQTIKKKNDIESKSENIEMTVEFNQGINDYDYGCISIKAGVDNIEAKKVIALYYSVYHELWKENAKLNKRFKEPTLKSTKNGVAALCNKAMSQNKSIEFLIYQRALKYNMSSGRFLDISEYINENMDKLTEHF